MILCAAKKMDTKAVIAQMSDSDLAKQLRSLKEDVGPITPNTRPIHERRLMRYLVLEEAASCTIPYTPASVDDTKASQTVGSDKHETVKCEDSRHINGSVGNLTHGVSDDGDVHSDAGDSAVFFGVQLQNNAAHSSGEISVN